MQLPFIFKLIQKSISPTKRLRVKAHPVINMHFNTHHFFIIRHDNIKTICCDPANIFINQQTKNLQDNYTIETSESWYHNFKRKT